MACLPFPPGGRLLKDCLEVVEDVVEVRKDRGKEDNDEAPLEVAIDLVEGADDCPKKRLSNAGLPSLLPPPPGPKRRLKGSAT